MAINIAGQTATRTISGDNPQYTEQTVVYDATAIVATDYTRFDAGFKARKVCITNLTDRVILEWNSSFPANTWVKHAPAATTPVSSVLTLDTTANALVINDRSVDVLQNAALGLVLASKTVHFEAWG